MYSLLSHARRSLFVSAALLTSAVIVTLATVKTFIGSLEQLIYWCANFALVTWSERPLAAAILLITAILLGIAIVRASMLLFSECRNSRRLHRWFSSLRDVHQELLFRMRFGHDVWVVRYDKPLALTFGILKPQIVFSTALVKLLSGSELKAVLYHEQHHQQKCDPRRRFFWSIAQKFFFFLPVMDDVAEGCLYRQEFSADSHVILSKDASRSHLRSGIEKLLRYHAERPVVASCLFVSTRDRLKWLLDEDLREPTLILRRKNILTSLIVSLVLVVFGLSGVQSYAQSVAGFEPSNAYCELAENRSTEGQLQSELPQGFVKINFSPLLE